MINVLIHVPNQEQVNMILKQLGITRYTVDTTKEHQIEFDFDDPVKAVEVPKFLRKQIEKIVKKGGGVSLSPKGEVLVGGKPLDVAEAKAKGERTKICPLCKTEFVPKGKQKYCDDCKKQYGEQVSRELRRRQREERNPLDR